MLFVKREINWGRNAPPTRLVADLPKKWQGLPIVWDDGYVSELVFIDQLQFENRDIYIFGARFNTVSAAFEGGARLPAGFFINYTVVSCFSEKAERVAVLAQHGGPIYGEVSEKNDWMWAKRIPKDRYMSLINRPRWKMSEAQWPLSDGKPMQFLGQVVLPENEVSREFLTWGKSIYLFSDEGMGRFKITSQDTDLQTAEEHYLLEGRDK